MLLVFICLVLIVATSDHIQQNSEAVVSPLSKFCKVGGLYSCYSNPYVGTNCIIVLRYIRRKLVHVTSCWKRMLYSGYV